MRTLTDSINVDAPPERVWSWLAELAGHYPEWHPDHISADWTCGEPNRVGSQLTAVENLAGHREELVFEMTKVDPPRRMEYRILGPHSIVIPGGSFSVVPRAGGSTFTAALSYRFGWFAELLFGRRIAALRSHMDEEGRNLKQLVEAYPPQGAPA